MNSHGNEEANYTIEHDRNITPRNGVEDVLKRCTYIGHRIDILGRSIVDLQTLHSRRRQSDCKELSQTLEMMVDETTKSITSCADQIREIQRIPGIRSGRSSLHVSVTLDKIKDFVLDLRKCHSQMEKELEADQIELYRRVMVDDTTPRDEVLNRCEKDQAQGFLAAMILQPDRIPQADSDIFHQEALNRNNQLMKVREYIRDLRELQYLLEQKVQEQEDPDKVNRCATTLVNKETVQVQSVRRAREIYNRRALKRRLICLTRPLIVIILLICACIPTMILNKRAREAQAQAQNH